MNSAVDGDIRSIRTQLDRPDSEWEACGLDGLDELEKRVESLSINVFSPVWNVKAAKESFRVRIAHLKGLNGRRQCADGRAVELPTHEQTLALFVDSLQETCTDQRVQYLMEYALKSGAMIEQSYEQKVVNLLDKIACSKREGRWNFGLSQLYHGAAAVHGLDVVLESQLEMLRESTAGRLQILRRELARAHMFRFVHHTLAEGLNAASAHADRERITRAMEHLEQYQADYLTAELEDGDFRLLYYGSNGHTTLILITPHETSGVRRCLWHNTGFGMQLSPEDKGLADRQKVFCVDPRVVSLKVLGSPQQLREWQRIYRTVEGEKEMVSGLHDVTRPDPTPLPKELKKWSQRKGSCSIQQHMAVLKTLFLAPSVGGDPTDWLEYRRVKELLWQARLPVLHLLDNSYLRQEAEYRFKRSEHVLELLDIAESPDRYHSLTSELGNLLPPTRQFPVPPLGLEAYRHLRTLEKRVVDSRVKSSAVLKTKAPITEMIPTSIRRQEFWIRHLVRELPINSQGHGAVRFHDKVHDLFTRYVCREYPAVRHRIARTALIDAQWVTGGQVEDLVDSMDGARLVGDFYSFVQHVQARRPYMSAQTRIAMTMFALLRRRVPGASDLLRVYGVCQIVRNVLFKSNVEAGRPFNIHQLLGL